MGFLIVEAATVVILIAAAVIHSLAGAEAGSRLVSCTIGSCIGGGVVILGLFLKERKMTEEEYNEIRTTKRGGR